MSLRAPLIIFALATTLLPAQSHGAAISTAEIASETLSASLACMKLRAVGTCFWLKCTYFSCDVEVSVKIGHYNPDLVVSVYNELGKNPWNEIRAILGQFQQAAANSVIGTLTNVPVNSAGNRTEGGGTRSHRNLIFREADVVGHPLGSLSDWLNGAGTLCESSIRRFRPYFQSGVDAYSWRNDFPESLYLASWLPGQREIGHWPGNTWGNVHPRTGWVTQADEPKAAAVAAQRAADIVTRSRQPHLYLTIGDRSFSDQQRWPPGPLTEADHRTGTWQMLSPVTDSECAAFGASDLGRTRGWGAGRVDDNGDYVWNLWRPYQCCERKGQLILIDINWMDYPE